jgi:hypothetical protein
MMLFDALDRIDGSGCLTEHVEHGDLGTERHIYKSVLYIKRPHKRICQ